MKYRIIFLFAFTGTLLFLVKPSFAQSQPMPIPRSGFALAFDIDRAVVVLFGGQDSANGRLGDLSAARHPTNVGY
jgi:hypothetical protein